MLGYGQTQLLVYHIVLPGFWRQIPRARGARRGTAVHEYCPPNLQPDKSFSLPTAYRHITFVPDQIKI